MSPLATRDKVVVVPAQSVRFAGCVVKVMVAAVVTVKLVALVAVFPPTVTVIFPVVAPAGTVVVILVVVLAETTAVVPLNFTVLLAGVALKFVPVMVTLVPTGPLEGVKLVMVGVSAAPTVNVSVLFIKG